jgi:poly(beta-D-mannuronate) lyase
VLNVLLSYDAQATDFVVSSAAQISSVMNSQAQPGDTLTMTTGTWTNQLVVFQGNGNALHPILLRSQGGYGSVVLNGTSTLRIAGNYLIVDGLKFQGGRSASGDVIEFRNGSSLLSNYCRLTNSAVIDYNPPNDSTDYKWISIHGSYNRVDHCAVSGKTHSGTTLVVWRPNSSANYHQIDHNYFGPRPELGYNGGETIRVGTSDQSLSSSFTVLEWNYFDQCNGEIEAISNKSCDNTYRYNTFVNCKATLTLRHGNRCRVEGNFFFGNGLSSTGGIRIIGEDHVIINNYISGTRGDETRSAISMMDGIVSSPLSGYYQVKRAIVAFNTLVDNTTSFDIGAGKDVDNVLPPLDCIIANNVVQTSYSPIITLTDTPINLLWEGNIMYGATLGITPVPSGITMLNPLLAPVGSDGLRHLNGGSPAINGAQGTYPQVVADMDGQPRNGSFDVGADEYSAAPVTIRPLSINDVGPNAVSYTITVSQGAHGSISPGTSTLPSGGTIRFVITPDPGYHVDSVLVDGVNVPDSLAGYTFNNVLTTHTISARFVIPQYTMTIAAVNGSIVRNPDFALYDSGMTVQLTAAPAVGYAFNAWEGDASGITNPIDVLMDGNKSITALFRVSGDTIRIPVQSRWNLMSIPLDPVAGMLDSLIPGAISEPYYYSGGYVADHNVIRGRGFWVKFPAEDTVSIRGTLVTVDSLDLTSGWNLVGSISVPVNVGTITANPPGLVLSQFFNFTGSAYTVAGTLEPGRGYWVKSTMSGKIFLTSGPLLTGKPVTILPVSDYPPHQQVRRTREPQ